MERHTDFRPRLSDPGIVSIAIRAPGCSGHKFDTIDLTDGGCSVRIGHEHRPDLAIGSSVIADISIPSAATPFRRTATVVARTDADASRTYDLQFVVPDSEREALSEALRRSFNERGALRVSIDPKAPVTAALSGGAGATPIRATVLNLSEGGLALTAPLLAEARFKDVVHIGVALAFPGAASPAELRAHLIARRLDGTNVIYRLAFLPAKTPAEHAAEHAIMQYVMARQRDRLSLCR